MSLSSGPFVFKLQNWVGGSALYDNKTLNKCYFYNSISINVAHHLIKYYHPLSSAIYSLWGLWYPLEEESMHASVCETSLYKLCPLYTKCHTVDNTKQHTDKRENPLRNWSHSCRWSEWNMRAVSSSVLLLEAILSPKLQKHLWCLSFVDLFGKMLPWSVVLTKVKLKKKTQNTCCPHFDKTTQVFSKAWKHFCSFG